MRDNDTHTLCAGQALNRTLMEIVHTAYLDNVFFNDNGKPETFISLVRRCDTLHVMSLPTACRGIPGAVSQGFRSFLWRALCQYALP